MPIGERQSARGPPKHLITSLKSRSKNVSEMIREFFLILFLSFFRRELGFERVAGK